MDTNDGLAATPHCFHGACLCGAVRFEFDGPLPKFYRCHCSLCRRQSGTAGNAATLIAAERFRWLSGRREIGSWTKASGFRSDFCRACGSPVPNPLRGQPYLWVPAGLLDGEAALEALEFVVDLHLASKAGWEETPKGRAHFAAMPPLDELLARLHASPPTAQRDPSSAWGAAFSARLGEAAVSED